MERLTNFDDIGIIPKLEEIVSELSKEQDRYIVNRLVELKIEPNILENQLKEIHRLNKILKEYKELEEQGRLIKLPCKVVDKVYLVLETDLDEYEIVESMLIGYCNRMNNEYFSMYIDCEEINDSLEFKREDFGKEIFLTREEAEAKLKEVQIEVNQWIPVTKDNPKKEGYYWCTIAKGKAADVCEWSNNRWYRTDGDGCSYYYKGVVAWMPLPDVYREDNQC